MRLTLFIDADDTLWDNSVYFEHAIADFVTFLDHPTLSADRVRERIDAIEFENIKTRGYGTENFTRNLKQCFAEFRERDCTPGEDEHISGITKRVWNHPVEPLDGV